MYQRYAASLLLGAAFALVVVVALALAGGSNGVALADDDVGTVNSAPMVETITNPTDPVPVNTRITISAVYTDPEVLDTHTASWDWGDGSTSNGTVHGLDVGPDNHTYTDAGIYTVKLTVTDNYGGVAEAISPPIVVYDPEGAFVTGGGWIDSPAGAYIADPSLAGKATFGFVSKYQKGASAPDGNTEFQFKAGDLNFHSDSYEWLVINQNDSNAQFKGSGTINGAGDYKFMLWAGDKDPDTFRIKIWVGDEEDNPVYDNGVAQPIGGGSIVIHKGKGKQ